MIELEDGTWANSAHVFKFSIGLSRDGDVEIHVYYNNDIPDEVLKKGFEDDLKAYEYLRMYCKWLSIESNSGFMPLPSIKELESSAKFHFGPVPPVKHVG